MIFQNYSIIGLTAGSINREIVMKLQGVIPPFITPLDEDEKIIERDVEKLTERLLEAGIRNIFLLGTMGEGPLIRDNEKEVLIRQTIAAAQDKATVIVNVSDASTNKILANIETAAKCGADIVATTVPIYLPLTEQELIIKFFHDVAERSSLPIALYDIPKLVNTSIEIDTIWEISKEKHIIGLKDSSGNFHIFRELVYLFRERDDFGLVTGDEWTIDASLLVGADGFVPGIGCLAPELCLELYEACIAKNVEKANELQDKLLRLFKIYGKNAGNWSAGIKEALKMVGVFSSNVVAKPMKPVDQKISAQVANILRDEGFIG
jgi:4-hydroxy-tetrahydrodipicolinate synthase